MVQFFVIAGVLGLIGLIAARQFAKHEIADDKQGGQPGELRCPKCQAPMVQGFLPDKDEHGFKLTSWVEGAPQGSADNVKVRSEQRVPIGAYRCSGCGFLELFARPEFEPKK